MSCLSLTQKFSDIGHEFIESEEIPFYDVYTKVEFDVMNQIVMSRFPNVVNQINNSIMSLRGVIPSDPAYSRWVSNRFGTRCFFVWGLRISPVATSYYDLQGMYFEDLRRTIADIRQANKQARRSPKFVRELDRARSYRRRNPIEEIPGGNFLVMAIEGATYAGRVDNPLDMWERLPHYSVDSRYGL